MVPQEIYSATSFVISIYFAAGDLDVIGLSIGTLAPVSESEIQCIVELIAGEYGYLLFR